jgi:biopolymer transport protein ExbB/TolQ
VDVFDYLARQDAGVSSSALAQAIRITFHPTELGLIIYLLSILATLVLKSRLSSLQSS